ncbi:MAG: energy transducer TonB [Sandaracinaceae bacterium]|nr:energy transducer TonB [Sandaracinaceae bacterium]
MTPPRRDPPAAPSIAGIVLSGRNGPPRRVTGFALIVGLAVHLGVGWASAMLPPPSPALVEAAGPPVRVSMAREIPLPPPAPVEAPPPARVPVVRQAAPSPQPTRAWRCDWPAAASSLDVDVEFVNMRVAVEASGEITDVRVVRHSGYGFDVEARRCALRHTLPPARDARGTPVRTASHPIRLRFER